MTAWPTVISNTKANAGDYTTARLPPGIDGPKKEIHTDERRYRTTHTDARHTIRHDLTTVRYSARCYGGRWWRRWRWWWASDIQRYHPRIYCSVKPGRQLGYKLVLCTARTATSRSYTLGVTVCARPGYTCVPAHVYVYVCVHVAGTSARSSSGGVVVYEYRMFMFLAAARQSLANIGSQFNDQPPIARNFPAVGSSRAALANGEAFGRHVDRKICQIVTPNSLAISSRCVEKTSPIRARDMTRCTTLVSYERTSTQFFSRFTRT